MADRRSAAAASAAALALSAAIARHARARRAARTSQQHQQILDRLARRTDLAAALDLADRIAADPDAVPTSDKLRYVAVSIDFGEAQHDPDAGTQVQDFLRLLASDLDAFAAAVTHHHDDPDAIRVAAETLADRLR